MRKYRVAAYRENGIFHHWASDVYYNKEVAAEYCEACVVKCTPQTGFTYKVEEQTE